jgi:hypothetical protein
MVCSDPLTQMISLIWGENWHTFKPIDLNLEPGSESYALQVLAKQINIFGPVPLKYQEIADEEARVHSHHGDQSCQSYPEIKTLRNGRGSGAFGGR